MEKVNPDFVKEYGKSWKNYFDKTFLISLISTLSSTLIFILIIANTDYSESNKKLSEIITREYIKTLFSDIRIDIPDAPIDSSHFFSYLNTTDVLIPTDKVKNDFGSSGNKISNNDIGIPGLNLNEVNLPETLVAVKNRNIAGIYARPVQPNKKATIDIKESKVFDPWKDPLQRQGEIFIEPVEEIIRGSQTIRGWRDPDEITFAIQKKEQMIEYCFKRDAKFFSDLHGYVIVRFIIEHTGFVDPSSVQIIKSTLYNKRIELCIKNRLRAWRGFEKLDISMGRVAVVQKFIFD